MPLNAGLRILEDDIDARITLAALLLEENREDEAISLLSPPNNLGDLDMAMHVQ